MPRLNFLTIRPQRTDLLSVSPSSSAVSSAEPPTSTSLNTYPSRCTYCPRVLGSEAAQSKHLANSLACKALADEAENAACQKRNQEREQGEVLDLHTKARECVQTHPALPEVTQKRQRIDIVDDSPVERMHSTTHNPPEPLHPVASSPAAQAFPSTSTSRLGQPNRPQEATPVSRGWIDPATGWYVEPYPDPLAGAPISDDILPPMDLEAYMRSCGDLGKPNDFEMVELLLTTRLTDDAKNRHMKSILYVGSNFPWQTTGALYSDVDKLRHGPIWHLYEINIQNQSRPADEPRVQYLVTRDIIHVIWDMMANPAFQEYMKYAPETHWTSAAMTEQIFSNMWSANWWPRMQEELAKQGKRDATLAPLIIATDQTKLSTLCGGQKAYPVYITLGNISKKTHGDIANDDERRRMKADLVHRAMETILTPLKAASKTGIEMWCADGRLRHVYPMVAAYIADWPEQNLQSCTSEGSCPVCTTKRQGRGDLSDDPAPLRDREETLNAICAYFKYRSRRDLEVLSLKPVWPWWGDLDHVNLATCLTPDLLHQLYQGIFKSHLVRWLQYLVGLKVLDQWFASMTRAEGMKHFDKGISHVQQWTGRESKDMSKTLKVYRSPWYSTVTTESYVALRSPT